MQKGGLMEVDARYQEALERMDHKSPALLALACGVLSGWRFWGWFRYSHTDDGRCGETPPHRNGRQRPCLPHQNRIV